MYFTLPLRMNEMVEMMEMMGLTCVVLCDIDVRFRNGK